MKRWCAALIVASACAGGLSACSGSEACVSWREYRSEADRRADADIVVLVDRVEPRGTGSAYGIRANVYDVRTVASEKGSVPRGGVLRVLSTPWTCERSTYPRGDPLTATPPLRLYLTEVDGRLETLTPAAGVERAATG